MSQIPLTSEIKVLADYQCNWFSVIAPLRKGRYFVESADKLSIPGEAPKYFVRIKEYIPGRPCTRLDHWTPYIAKLGSKWYPLESVTEQLFTRLGQISGLRIAESKLRVVGRQVRFLSKYFLGPKERLVHGLEIFRSHLDHEMVDAIAAMKKEQEFYTFQTVCAAMKDVFPDCHEDLMSGLVEMLAFDALVGNNDRHPANWGVVTKLTDPISPRFSPVFDTARGLFWNNSEKRLAQMLTDQNMLESYIEKSVPQIGWDGRQAINHLELVRLIYQNYPQYHPSLEKFADEAFNDKAETMIQGEFRQLMSAIRTKLIGMCLKLRQRLFRQAIS